MAPHEVISFFGTQVAASKALGISQPSIAMWVEVGIVPEVRQYQIELATKGKLKADVPALRTEASGVMKKRGWICGECRVARYRLVK